MKILKKIQHVSPTIRLKLLLIMIGLFLFIGANIVGISDNLPGILLLFASVASILFALVYHWKTIRNYSILLIASTIGFPIMALLHNLFYAFAEAIRDLAFLKVIFHVIEVASFLIAIIICPVGILTGIIGIITLTIKKRISPDTFNQG